MKTRYTPPALAEGSTPDNDTLLGTLGKDTLDGGLGADTMTGLGGNDLYYVDNALDQVIEQMGGGIDTVSASVSYTLGTQVERLVLTGNANLNGTGNELNNIITGNIGANVLSGGAGNDSLKGGGGYDTLLGGDGNDTLNASQNAGGTVDGGMGTDTFVMDRSSLSTGVSWNSGISINGVSVTGVERFVLSTGSGNDNIFATEGQNTLDAGAGNDLLWVGRYGSIVYDADRVNAGSGDDVMLEVSGRDTIDGGDGFDKVVLSLSGIGGTVNTSGNTAWLWNATGSVSGTTRVDANSDWASVNSLVSTSKHFQFVNTDASTGVDLYNIEFLGVKGTGANDLIFDLDTGSGTPTSGYSRYHDGGAGIDTFFANWSNTTVAVGWSGGGTALIPLGAQGSVQVSGMERLLLSTGSGNDGINNSNYTTNDDIRTNAGNDNIFAGEGQDTLDAGAGNDLLWVGRYGSIVYDADRVNAGSGDDVMLEVSGRDTIDGGDGFDKVSLSLSGIGGTVNMSGNTAWLWNATGSASGTTRVDANSDWASVNSLVSTGKHFQFVNTDASTGVDLYNIEFLGVKSTGANDLIFDLDTGSGTPTFGYNRYHDGGAGIDTFFANWSSTTVSVWWGGGGIALTTLGAQGSVQVSGMERLLLSTGSGNDRIDNYLNATNDDIRTNAGNDTLYGGGGNDILDAGSGLDQLIGGSGNDTLIGGSGNDTLSLSDGGNDRIVLTSLDGNDSLTGFVSGSDVIQLSQSAMAVCVGDGDRTIDGGVVLSSTSDEGFDASAELVIITDNLSGVISYVSAAALIGDANTDYLTGQQALFAVDNGTSSQLYLFTSSGNDATVSAAELTLLATLTGTASTAVADYALI